MWAAWAGWWCGAGAAGALLVLLLALRCRRRKQPRAARAGPALTVHQVHIVRDACRASPAARPAPRRAVALLAGAPAPAPPPPPAPHIVIIQNSTPSAVAPGSGLLQSPPPVTDPPAPAEPGPSGFKGLPKLPLPEQWLHKRPYDYKYCSTIPRPLVQIFDSQPGEEPSQETKAKKFSATRSPSLERDEKSPFPSGDAIEPKVFGFDDNSVGKAAAGGEPHAMEVGGPDVAPGDLKRFRSVSTRLDVCGEPPPGGPPQRAELQNSPRVLECSSAKEKSSAPKFDFSPRILADSLCSPRFFTPPETVSPMFFADPSPKSVYYDTVRSPKFFPETPRDADAPQVPPTPHSPRALGDHVNRNGGEKAGSPRVLSARPSPKLYSCNKENYFTFENVCVGEEVPARMSPRLRRYAGRNSIEKERFTPPAEKEVKKYRRDNSCDTNYKNIEPNDSDNKDVKSDVRGTSDEVDCCAKIESLQIDDSVEVAKPYELKPSSSSGGVSVQARRDRQRLKSISLDSDNAKIIEQNLGLPIAKQMKDQMNEAYKNQDVSTSCESMERHLKTPTNERPLIKFDDEQKDKNSGEEEPKSPHLKHKKCLRQSSDTQSFIDMPRFSPKEFEITVTSEEGATTSAEAQTKRKGKNLRNLTIDLTKRDSDLEKELLEFEKLYTDAEEKKVKTPTLKVKATSLDSSETVNLSLPQKKTLDVPQNSVSVPNTPKRQLKRLLAQKSIKHDYGGAKMGYNSIQSAAEQRRLYMKGQDSGIFLRENHANLMLYQPGGSRLGPPSMGSFDENMTENAPEINICESDSPGYYVDPGQTLGSNLMNYKQNLSVSSTNLKTLPEGVTSDDFEPSVEDEKFGKKLHRRNSNQSLMLSTHSLQGSNCSLNSAGASCHNLANVRSSMSNFCLNSQKFNLSERKESNLSLINAEHFAPMTRVICSSNTSLTGEGSKNCLLQRRGSNNSLTLNIQSNSLSRHSSNSSLNKEMKPVPKKGLLERRSSNTSLTLNINNSNPQLSVVNRGLSVSNYNLNGSTCSLSRYNSNQSIDNAEPRKGILERRSSNTSLTLNIQPQEPRDIDIDENVIQQNLNDLPHKETHRKSLSTENLIPKSYKTRTRLRNSENKPVAFGSHDNLWSSSYTERECPQNLTYVCGDRDNEIIYAFGRQEAEPGAVRSITTKPLSPQSTSEDFRLYLANMQHLQNATSILSRKQLRDLHDVFQNGYSKVKCHSMAGGAHCCTGTVDSDVSKDNPQTVIPEISQPCSEYQKMLLRNLHQEFWDMPTNFQEKPIVSGSHTKNRYKTILPNEHSRFILRGEPPDPPEGYINANFIKGHEYTRNSYIATQGPLQNTIYDFWLMVAQNTTDHRRPTAADERAVQKVVMLTNFVENNRQKCEKYFPLELDEVVVFSNPEPPDPGLPADSRNSFVIRNCGVIRKSGYTIRKLDVRHERRASSDSRPVYHYWFHNWADHKCPNDVTALLNLSLDVLRDAAPDFASADDDTEDLCKCNDSPEPASKFVFPPSECLVVKDKVKCDARVLSVSPLDVSVDRVPPPVVHCSAGIGRTGCLIAILNGIQQLLAEGKVDVLGIVCNMRLNRGGMVQNSEQYELVHKVLCLFERVCLPDL